MFAKGDKAREAEEAGADDVGAEDLAERVEEEGFTDFDVAIATPDMMPVVGKLGRDPRPAGQDAQPEGGHRHDGRGQGRVASRRPGKVEYRTDRHAIVHLPIGKLSFDERTLLENYAALIDEIIRAKPAAAKGRYLRRSRSPPRMGPGVKVDPAPHPRHRRGGRAGSLDRPRVSARDPRRPQA